MQIKLTEEPSHHTHTHARISIRGWGSQKETHRNRETERGREREAERNTYTETEADTQKDTLKHTENDGFVSLLQCSLIPLLRTNQVDSRCRKRPKYTTLRKATRHCFQVGLH